jgi:hypothetical protein
MAKWGLMNAAPDGGLAAIVIDWGEPSLPTVLRTRYLPAWVKITLAVACRDQ